MTMLVDLVATRLDAEVPALTGHVEFIADLAALVAEGAMPQAPVAAFVVTAGEDGGEPDAATGLYTQMMGTTVSVIVCVKALGDAKARKALPKIDGLNIAIVDSIVGWGPENAVGVFRFVRGRLVSANKGLVIYQNDFAIQDQLRVDPDA